MSALTAALKGGSQAPPPSAAGKLDAASFPCIQEGGALPDEDLGLTLAELALNKASIAGSAPTRAHHAGSYTVRSAGRDLQAVVGGGFGWGGRHGCLGQRVPPPPCPRPTMSSTRTASGPPRKCTPAPRQARGGRGRQAQGRTAAPHAPTTTLPGTLQNDEFAARNFWSEAVMGSLPKGLSVPEREKIVASTPLSPTLNLLGSLPLDRVTSRSADGRKLRRHVLRLRGES